MSPLLLTLASEWFLAMENAVHSSKKHSYLLRQWSATERHLVYRVLCVCWVVVLSAKECYSHQSLSLEFFCAAFVFHRGVLQLVEQCYCRSSSNAWVREMVGNSLLVTMSFLKIRDERLIQSRLFSFLLVLESPRGTTPLFFWWGRPSETVYQNTDWGNRRSWLSLFLLEGPTRSASCNVAKVSSIRSDKNDPVWIYLEWQQWKYSISSKNSRKRRFFSVELWTSRENFYFIFYSLVPF